MTADDWENLNEDARQHWETNAAFWDSRMGLEGNPTARLLVFPTAEKLLELQAGEHVLELACGNGTFARRLAGQGLSVTATDYSQAFIDIARTYPSERIAYHVVDATSPEQLLALGAGRFDAAVCNMALMDMAAIEPLFATLPRLLKPQARFVFTIMHPCFNSIDMVRMVEEREYDGEIVLEFGVKISHYHTPKSWLGVGIVGQPEPHRYFHRPLHALLGACFLTGWVVDGWEEGVYPGPANPDQPFSWSNFTEIPFLLGVRLRQRG